MAEVDDIKLRIRLPNNNAHGGYPYTQEIELTDQDGRRLSCHWPIRIYVDDGRAVARLTVPLYEIDMEGLLVELLNERGERVDASAGIPAEPVVQEPGEGAGDLRSEPGTA